MTQPVIAVRGVSKAFSGVKALDHIDFEIHPGEIHCLAGENGSGKSTLIKVISGVYEPDEGEIILNGRSHSKLTPIEAIHHGIQVIYQDFSVFPNLTVMENLALTSELSERRTFVNWKRFRQIAEKAVKKINFSIDLDARVSDLSVADKQLVAISRALLTDTKLIIMDEPTTALTDREVAALFRVILDLQARGIAILFVSHKLDEVFEISERFTIIRNGKLVITSLPEELTHQKFAQYMTGRDVSEETTAPTGGPGEIALEAEGLSLKDAFHDVSFTLRKGEVLGVTGLLGSGRTELALTLFGVFTPDSGQLKVGGKPVTLRSIRDAIANGIGYVPEDRLSEGLMLERSIGDNIVISEIDKLSTGMGVTRPGRRQAEVDRWVDELAIATKNPYNAVNTLSGGNQQRVVLAKWLATDPDVLILNGPTVGVDIGSKHDIHVILKELAESGMGIIVISDDIPELLRVTNRVLLLQEGRIVAEVDPTEISQHDLSAMITGATKEN
ncbi:sugar ABC transporter ATP-binding protein [Tessaracoccus sp. ZS01]|uniref:sugar ABC transporter ATP-binding protein n=1 Tax=Tessaracoccus sp. ZS01 TaxID=1906324 RepID=UPI00096BF827|nr:sugar ABC transporter ATP-binding protein [Tessaracoccus sp. ZS01]MCG6567824.1 sugar ABC transporter ATP-binding protein [Tessaracoccus sp. ZS01]OMG55557.1 lipase [Tessaracoccus sp. ZS01]